MDSFSTVLLLACLPAAGNLVGGVLSEAVRVSYRTLSLALHAAAGILFAVVGVELMPEALTAEPAWLIILAFVAGGGAFLLLDSAIHSVQHRFTPNREAGGEDKASPWGIYFATALDLFSDGLMIGASATISFELSLLLALGQVTADVPEGFATVASFKHAGMERGRRLLLTISFILPVLVGAAIGFFLVRGQPDVLKYSVLSFTAGILLTTVVEEIIPQAHKEQDARLAALLLVGGFALFSFISVYLG